VLFRSQQISPRQSLGSVMGGFESVRAAAQLLALFAVPLIVPALLSLVVYFGITAAVVLALALATALAIKGRDTYGATASSVVTRNVTIET
jgi:hypothetical protein